MTTSINAIYTGFEFEVVVDGAGLNIIATGKTPRSEFEVGGAGHELFLAVVDNYPFVGLAQALENAGATINVKVGA
jgi:hypothetical protein